MKLKIGRDDTFDCPEGKHKGVIERIGEPKTRINKPCEQQIRITIRVKTPDKKEYLVARTFCADLSNGSEFFHFLIPYLEESDEQFTNANQEIDLNLLIGKEVDVLVTHFDDGKHDRPFVKIAGIFSPGTLVDE